MKKILSLILILAMFCSVVSVLSVSAAPKTYYVSASRGNNYNNASFDKPYKTISAGKEKLQAGDTLIVEGGIYSESFAFVDVNGTASAPYTIKGAEGEEVIITSYDPVQTKWNQYEDNIYKTTLPEKPDVDHVLWKDSDDFKNMLEARWPNADADRVLEQDRATAKTGTDKNGIYDYLLPEGDWTGGKVTTWTGKEHEQYVSFTRKIATYSEGELLTFDKEISDGTELYEPNKGVWYYISGALCGLDVAREFYYNKETGELYVIMPDGEKPALDEIWVQTREDAIDYYNCSYINLENLTIIGGGVGVDSGSHHCTMDNVDVFYNNFFDDGDEWGDGDGYSTLQKRYNGNHFHGDYNVWKNSEIAYTMTSGIMIAGNHNRVENNYIHDINWAGGYNAAVFTEGEKQGNYIGHNTLTRSGRFLIYYTYGSKIKDTIIEYNEVSFGNYLTCDGGGIYMYHSDAQNSFIRYNWVYDMNSNGSCGIYLDNATTGMVVHNNVVWNTNQAGIALNTPSLNNKIYHNTVFDCGQGIQGWPKDADSSQEGTEIINNLIAGTVEYIQGSKGPKVESNVIVESNLPMSDNFMPKGNAVDKGKKIPGFNDKYTGSAPDIGAYELGEYWVAGVDSKYFADFDKNGKITSVDVLTLKKAILNNEVMLSMDLNRDSKINATDLLVIKRMILAIN